METPTTNKHDRQSEGEEHEEPNEYIHCRPFQPCIGHGSHDGYVVGAQSAQPTEEKTPTAAAMMERCQEMKEQKQKLKEDMKAQDAQLTEQLVEMNRAPKDKKVGLMATALTGMVQQRITMDARKAKMEDEMMQHMQMGKESMSQCPMMKSMKDMDENPVGAHKEPQEQQK